MTKLLTFCGSRLGNVLVVTGFETGVIVTDDNRGFAWVNFVSDNVGFVVVKLLMLEDVGGNGDGGDDFVGDSKVTQGSLFSNFEVFICSDK